MNDIKENQQNDVLGIEGDFDMVTEIDDNITITNQTPRIRLILGKDGQPIDVKSLHIDTTWQNGRETEFRAIYVNRKFCGYAYYKNIIYKGKKDGVDIYQIKFEEKGGNR